MQGDEVLKSNSCILGENIEPLSDELVPNALTCGFAFPHQETTSSMKINKVTDLAEVQAD